MISYISYIRSSFQSSRFSFGTFELLIVELSTYIFLSNGKKQKANFISTTVFVEIKLAFCFS